MKEERHNIPKPPDVETEERTKFLGIIINEKVSWKQNIDSLCSKLNISLYVLKKIKHKSTISKYCNHWISRSLWISLAVWHCHLSKVLHLETSKEFWCFKSYRKSWIASNEYNESCREKFSELKILTAIAHYVWEHRAPLRTIHFSNVIHR